MTQETACEATVQIINIKGIHARSAAKIVKVAESFEAEVTVTYKGTSVSALSIMGLMLLSARQGAMIHLKAEGPEENDVLKSLIDLIAAKFDED